MSAPNIAGHLSVSRHVLAFAGALALSAASSAAIEFTDQLNHLSATVAEERATADNSVVTPFEEAISASSPHRAADLTVVSEQSLSFSTDLTDGSDVIKLSGFISVLGSDFHDDGGGGLFSVAGTSHAAIEFTLSESVQFNITASISDDLPGSYADAYLLHKDGGGHSTLLEVGSFSETDVQTTYTLEPGTYLLEAFLQFSEQGPGEWSGSAEYNLSIIASATCHADLTGDGTVDVFDLIKLINHWGECANPGNCPADLNSDGVVDVFDLIELMNFWGECSG